MPKISKQTIKKVVKKKVVPKKGGGGVLDRIVPVAESESKNKISIYGLSGTGKTALLSTFPKPLLVIGSERGTRTIRDVEGVDYVKLEDSQELFDLVDHVRQNGNYACVGLDTATNYQALTLKEVLGLNALPTQSSWGMATREQYGTSTFRTKEALRYLLNLAEEEIADVVILSQERDFEEQEESELKRELVVPTIMPSMTASTVGWFNPECDFILHTFKAPRIETKKIKVAKDKVTEQSVVTDDVNFCLRIGPHPIYLTKFRCGPDEWENLPKFIVDPTYDKLASYF